MISEKDFNIHPKDIIKKKPKRFREEDLAENEVILNPEITDESGVETDGENNGVENNENGKESNVEAAVEESLDGLKKEEEKLKEENKEIINDLTEKKELNDEDIEKAKDITEESEEKVKKTNKKAEKDIKDINFNDESQNGDSFSNEKAKEDLAEKKVTLNPEVTDEPKVEVEEEKNNNVENNENKKDSNVENNEEVVEKEEKEEFTEENILNLFSENGIEKEDLDKISGFSDLNLSAKKIVFDLFDKVCLEKVESKVAQEEAKIIVKKKSKIGKMGMALSNLVSRKKKERKAMAEVLGVGFTPEREEELNNLVQTFNNTEIKTEFSPEGEIVFDFVEMDEEDREIIKISKNKDVIGDLNDKANVLANMPKYKKYESKKDRIKYEKAQEEYEEGKKSLEEALKSFGKTDAEVMKALLDMDVKTNNIQFLKDYPDLEAEWSKMGKGKLKRIFEGIETGEIFKKPMKISDKAAFFAGGAVVRKLTLLGVGAVAGAGSLVSFAAIPLTAAGIGAVRGRKKGKEVITKTEKNIDKKDHWKDSKVFKDKEIIRKEYVEFYKNNNIEELLKKKKKREEQETGEKTYDELGLQPGEKKLLEKSEELYADWKKKEKIEEEASKKGNNKTKNKTANQIKKAKEDYDVFCDKNNIENLKDKQKKQEELQKELEESEEDKQLLEKNEELVLNLKSMDEAIFESRDQGNKKIERSTLRAQDLTVKLDYLVDEIEKEKNKKDKDDEKISNYLNTLKRRIDFTQKKSENNLVNFGGSKENLNNNINFFKKLAEAHMFLADNIDGMKDNQQYKKEKKEKNSEGKSSPDVTFIRVDERAEGLLNYFEEIQGKKLSKERKKYLKKAMIKGAKMGAIFSAAGAASMDIIQHDGIFQIASDAISDAKGFVEDSVSKIGEGASDMVSNIGEGTETIISQVSGEDIASAGDLYEPVGNASELLGKDVFTTEPLIQKNIELLKDLDIPENVAIDDHLAEIINDSDLPFKEDILSSESLINSYDEIKDWPEDLLKHVGEAGEVTDKDRALVEFFNNHNLTPSEQEAIFEANVANGNEVSMFLGELRTVTEEIKEGSNFTETLRNALKNCNEETKDAFIKNVDSKYNIFSDDVILSDENRSELLKKAVNRLSVEGANPESGVANLVHEGNVLRINSETGAWEITQGSSEFEPQAVELESVKDTSDVERMEDIKKAARKQFGEFENSVDGKLDETKNIDYLEGEDRLGLNNIEDGGASLSSENDVEVGGSEELTPDISDVETGGSEELIPETNDLVEGDDFDVETEPLIAEEDIEKENILGNMSKEERDLIVSEMTKNVDGYDKIAHTPDKEKIEKIVGLTFDNADEHVKEILKRDMLKLKYPGLEPDMAELMFRNEVISKAIPSIGDDVFCIRDVEILDPTVEYSISGKGFCLADRLDEITDTDGFFENLTERDKNKLMGLIDDIRERDTFNPTKHGRKLEKFLIGAYNEYR